MVNTSTRAITSIGWKHKQTKQGERRYLTQCGIDATATIRTCCASSGSPLLPATEPDKPRPTLARLIAMSSCTMSYGRFARLAHGYECKQVVECAYVPHERLNPIRLR